MYTLYVCVCVCMCVLSCVQLFVTPWTIAHQDPLSMTFSRQEYWSGLPFPTPWDIPDPGIEHMSPESLALQADSLPLSHVYCAATLFLFNLFIWVLGPSCSVWDF